VRAYVVAGVCCWDDAPPAPRGQERCVTRLSYGVDRQQRMLCLSAVLPMRQLGRRNVMRHRYLKTLCHSPGLPDGMLFHALRVLSLGEEE